MFCFSKIQAIALVHLFVEANEGFAKLGHEYEKTGSYYFLVGLLFPMFVEKILMKHDAHEMLKESLAKSLLSLYMLLSLLAVHSLIEGLCYRFSVDSLSRDCTWSSVAWK
jgi:zinc transporter ZupT